jgi:hypothetical protein
MSNEAEVLRLLREVHASGANRELLLQGLDRRVEAQGKEVVATRVAVEGIKVSQASLEERVTRLEERDDDHTNRCPVIGPLGERVRRLEDAHEAEVRQRNAAIERANESRGAWKKWGWERAIAVILTVGTLIWGWFTNKKH